MMNNDKQTGKEESVKVHKLPQELYDQATLTKEINEKIYN